MRFYFKNSTLTEKSDSIILRELINDKYYTLYKSFNYGMVDECGEISSCNLLEIWRVLKEDHKIENIEGVADYIESSNIKRITFQIYNE